MIARTISETRRLDELKEEYDRVLGEHEAWVALLGVFDPATEAGADEARDADPGSPDDDGSEAEPASG